jgi:hypothetical protein
MLSGYWRPDDGWERGTVARLCTRCAFSHVEAYIRQMSALRGTADSLLDSASYGSGRPGRARSLRPGPVGAAVCQRPPPRPAGARSAGARWRPRDRRGRAAVGKRKKR